MWLTGMKRLIFYVNNLLGSGHFFNQWYSKKDPKIAGIKNVFVSKKYFVMLLNHAKKFLLYVLYFRTFLPELQIAPIILIVCGNLSSRKHVCTDMDKHFT